MRILALDLETAPMVAYIWQLKQNGYITTDKIVKDGYTLCWAAKWVGEPKVMFDSIHKSSKKDMLKNIHKLMDEADCILTYNGTSFDNPILNKEFIEAGMAPPAPYKHIDLIKTARSQFRFASNKLDWVATKLGLGGKVKHKGMELWTECMAGNNDGWRTMEKYNKQDVVLLEKLYYKMLPWIKNHPNHGLYDSEGRPSCPNCGGKRLQRRGFATTTSRKYARYQCTDCGKWVRSGEKEPLGTKMMQGA